ncbi:short-chain dehydrogenase reductase sdr [Pyrenophora seminiperda CCB06]|uniref:Short-chain dehydrogenase reductase sdr n=1 Tax=Pyrenophora seminiperda CCB06 TaxID=1302712 RepID=A0A3M7MBH1_9PLEO|nr:short-chain dehydrogenase reductase sdr [Pyrenophora seminiperda CCB06]
MLVELKSGETLNGLLVNCDTWMNLTLREVVQTSADGDKFMRLPEIYVRGSTIKYLRVPDEIVDIVKEQQAKDQANRGGRGGGMHGRGDHRGDRGGGRGTRGRGRGRGRGGGGGAGAHTKKLQGHAETSRSRQNFKGGVKAVVVDQPGGLTAEHHICQFKAVFFYISRGELDNIKDQVVVITGASSGIGLATVRRIIQHGGKVFASDLNPLPEPEASAVPFMKVDVTSWDDQLKMFKAAEHKYGKVDHVYANAGIGTSTSLLEEDVDSEGNLLPPKLNTMNVNLVGVMYTVKLGIHYLKKNPDGGSIVLAASAASFAIFPAADYSVTKHGVLGLLRAFQRQLYPELPIRINATAPSWTDAPILQPEVKAMVQALVGEDGLQSPDVVACSAVLLMADKERHGELVYSQKGKFMEMEQGERGFHAFLAKPAQIIKIGENM